MTVVDSPTPTVGNIRGFLLTTERHAIHGVRTWSMQTHEHDELIWTTAGVMRVSAAGAIWTVPSHRAIWIPRRVPHTIDVAADTILHATFFGHGVVRHLPADVVIVELIPAVRELLLLNAAEPMRGETRMRLQQLAIELLRPVPTAHVDLTMPESPRPLLVAEKILASLASSDTTEQWAQRVGMPPRQLARAFAKETGLSLTQWRIRARVRTSLVMLGSGQPVATTARRLGYSSTGTFIDHFRSVVGTTPAAYFEARRV